VLTLSKTSFKSVSRDSVVTRDSVVDAKKKIFRPIRVGLIDFFCTN